MDGWTEGYKKEMENEIREKEREIEKWKNKAEYLELKLKNIDADDFEFDR